MKATILLDYNENLKKIEEEEKARFLHGLLEQFFENTDVVNQIQSIWSDDVLSPEQKVKMRSILTTYNIHVIDDLEGRLEIFIDNELVANWNKPIYKLKKDLSQRDRKKQLYIEMYVECWSVFEQSEQQSEQEI